MIALFIFLLVVIVLLFGAIGNTRKVKYLSVYASMLGLAIIINSIILLVYVIENFLIK